MNSTYSLQFTSIESNESIKIDSTLKSFLDDIGREDLFQIFSLMIQELAGNADKANLKSVHFLHNRLNINNPNEYLQGMSSFKKDGSKNKEEYHILLKQKGLLVTINMFVEEDSIVISVINNRSILPIEKLRITNNMNKSSPFTNLEDLFDRKLDTIEGGGLGTIIMLMQLRDMGLDENVFSLIEEENSTEARLTIPLGLINIDESEIIANSIMIEIQGIPQFPQHIIKLQQKLSNPNSQFSDIADIINTDPSLTANLLKMANSSFYSFSNQISNIEDAVKMIGFDGVKHFILAFSSQKILANKYNLKVQKEIMQHSTEVADYAYKLSKLLNVNSGFEVAYLSGILHDFGKIIVSAIKPDMMNNIGKICKEKGINPFIMENFSNGYNHAIIGARLAERWNFPEPLIQAIKYHHIPVKAELQYSGLLNIIYLADRIYYLKRGQCDFSEINQIVLKRTQLTDEDKFKRLVEKL